MFQHLISIITPSFNSKSHIIETYRSICSQTYTNWEWLVTDDFSTDGSYEEICNLANDDLRVKVFRNPENSGAAVSRNKSLSNVSGRFIAFLDSDDLWDANKLSIQLNYMVTNDVAFSFTAFEMINLHGVSLNKKVDLQQFKPLNYKDMLRKKATLGCSTVMLDNSLVGPVQMPSIRTGQDYGLWLKILKKGLSAYPIPQVLTQYRILPHSISRNKFRKAKRQWMIYREIEGLNIYLSSICFCFYAWRAVFRK